MIGPAFKSLNEPMNQAQFSSVSKRLNFHYIIVFNLKFFVLFFLLSAGECSGWVGGGGGG